jgi:hypothetical protein
VKELLVQVEVVRPTDTEEETLLRRFTVNFYDKACRELIAKTAWWAMHKGLEMISHPVSREAIVEDYDHREEGIEV